MHTVLADIRYALRQLRRSPGFTITTLLTLILTIGATTAMVSVLRATLLNPTPYTGAQELVSVADTNLKGFHANGLVTVARAADLAAAPGPSSKPLFRSSAFFYYDQPTLTIAGHAPVSTAAVAASGEFFRVLGTAPLLGRAFTPADDAHGAPETAVLSYGLWQRAFGGDPSVVGRNVLLFGKATDIIGVMPRHFDYPVGTELWKPAHLFARDFEGYRGDGTRFVQVLARLENGISPAQAQAGADTLASRLAKSYAATDADWGFHITGVRSQILGTYRAGLLLLSSAVAILLVIATANIAGLQISRNVARRQEIAVRRALGVSTTRLLQQFLTESLILFVLGAVPGALLAAGLLRVLGAALPATLLRFEQPHVDRTTLLVTAAVALVAGILCALAPAVRLGGTPAAGVPQTRAIHGGRHRFGRGFAVAQIALALVLLTLASGVLRNLYTLLTTPLGYDPSHVLTMSLHLPFGTDPGRIHRFYRQIEEGLAAQPGITAAGSIDAPPLAHFSALGKADIFGEPPTAHRDRVSAEQRSITPGYLATMRIPLLAGRNLVPADREPNAPSVLLVNQSFAARYFPRGSAVGKRLVFSVGADSAPTAAVAEIVGVVGDVHGTGGALGGPVLPEIDGPEKGYWPDMHFVLRTALPPSSLDPAIRTLVSGVDPDAAVGPLETLTGSVNEALAQPRLNSALLSALAALALLLVLIGVYGVLAFSVAARTQELAVRLALGSSRSAILRLLLGESTAMLALGLALGVAGALAASRLLAAAVSLGAVAPTPSTIAPEEVLTLSLTSALLACAVLAAGFIPARRATSIDPMQALRSE